MMNRYFSFSGVLSRKEFLALIMRALLAYAMTGAMIIVSFPSESSIGFGALLVVSAVLLWSVFSIASRYLSGIKINQK